MAEGGLACTSIRLRGESSKVKARTSQAGSINRSHGAVEGRGTGWDRLGQGRARTRIWERSPVRDSMVYLDSGVFRRGNCFRQILGRVPVAQGNIAR